MLCSFHALYASGMEVVFGGMIVTAVGYLMFGHIADRLLEPPLTPWIWNTLKDYSLTNWITVLPLPRLSATWRNASLTSSSANSC